MALERISETATIDHPNLILGTTKIGDIVGECGGVVDGFDIEGVVVSALPDPDTCQRCLFSEYCTSSKAD